VKLILTREVAGLGLAGDIVDVADGYGRNFLVPRGDAINWTKGTERQIAQIRRARDAREIRDRGHARELKDDLEKLSVSIEARAGKDGRLFGSITAGDIAAAVKDAGGPTLDRKRIKTDGHIKTTGTHTVTVDLHPDVTASLPVLVRGV
jgi:large subunit ribosomal protein L9